MIRAVHRQTLTTSRFLSSPGTRLALSGALMLTEVLSMTLFIETGNLRGATGLARIAMKGSTSLRLLVMAMVLSAMLAFLELRRHPAEVEKCREGRTFYPAALVANLAAFLAFAATSFQLFSLQTPPGSHNLLTVLCVVSGSAMLVSATCVFVPGETWQRIFRIAPLAPLFGFLTTVATFVLTAAIRPVWMPWMRLTYQVVLTALRLLRGNVVTDAGSFLLGTKRFTVIIAPECSGYEGMALMLVFGSGWLWLFRNEFRFPRALLLLPFGILAIWILNCIRILALVLIGDAGAPAVAAGGFHSEAGWISFVVLASALLLASQHIPWIRTSPPERVAGSQARKADETAAYLAPFLAILASGMLAHAASSSFEWLYPVRVVAAIAAVWWFRKSYAGLSWRVGWQAIATGVLVFAIWVGTAPRFGTAGAGIPPELGESPDWIRLGWLAFRVAGAVLTVPIAEELAFRGYVLRRLVSADFTAVKFRTASYTAIAISSVLFGAMHGSRWMVGMTAGALYAAVARKRESLGDAVAAHAITNALLTGWVLSTGQWNLW